VVIKKSTIGIERGRSKAAFARRVPAIVSAMRKFFRARTFFGRTCHGFASDFRTPGAGPTLAPVVVARGIGDDRLRMAESPG
jgi:hypothetical protein